MQQNLIQLLAVVVLEFSAHWLKTVKNGSGKQILLLCGCQLLSLKSAEKMAWDEC